MGLCLASSPLLDIAQVIVTDQKDHMDFLCRNAERNLGKMHSALAVAEFDWLRGKDGTKNLEPLTFDVIVGTDVAYCKELYKPVVMALDAVAGPASLIILGVTRTDTGPLFFQYLHCAGFDYCLLPIAGDGNSSLEAGGFALISVVQKEKRPGWSDGVK